nr:hypothetical protein [Tanacetum cinerariifolium]
MLIVDCGAVINCCSWKNRLVALIFRVCFVHSFVMYLREANYYGRSYGGRVMVTLITRGYDEFKQVYVVVVRGFYGVVVVRMAQWVRDGRGL